MFGSRNVSCSVSYNSMACNCFLFKLYKKEILLRAAIEFKQFRLISTAGLGMGDDVNSNNKISVLNEKLVTY